MEKQWPKQCGKFIELITFIKTKMRIIIDLKLKLR